MEHSNEFLAAMYGAYYGHKNYTMYNQVVDLEDGFTELKGDSMLTLTPLSKITDEDAIEVAKVCAYFNGSDNHRADIGRAIIKNVTGKNGRIKHYPNIIKAFDLLRSKGYDCGFRHIPSLIEAGLAIDKTTLTN